MTKRSLEPMIQDTRAEIKRIMRSCAAGFDVTEEELTSGSGVARLSCPRFVCMYLCIRAGCSHQEVAYAFNRKLKMSYYAVKQVRDRMSINARFKTLIESLEEQILRRDHAIN